VLHAFYPAIAANAQWLRMCPRNQITLPTPNDGAPQGCVYAAGAGNSLRLMRCRLAAPTDSGAARR
jgi:hypothetical protein